MTRGEAITAIYGLFNAPHNADINIVGLNKVLDDLCKSHPEQEEWPEEPAGHMAGGVRPSQQKPMHPELRKMWEDYFDKCFRTQPEQEYHAVNAVHKGQQCYVKAQPEQPKVRTGNCLRVGVCASEGHKIAPQRTWVGLTELEKAEITSLKWWDWEDTFDIEGFIRAIEAKLKEKNT